MMSEPVNAAELEESRERPFPWRCPRCHRKEVRRESVNYQCQHLHEGQPVTVAVVGLQVPRCAVCGELVFDYFTEEQINAAYLKRYPALFANGALPVSGSEASRERASAKKSMDETEIVERRDIRS